MPSAESPRPWSITTATSARPSGAPAVRTSGSACGSWVMRSGTSGWEGEVGELALDGSAARLELGRELEPSAERVGGLVGGLGFMLGELPNSFVKRQLDVAPGGAPRGRLAATACFLADRLDSILGLLLAVHLTFGLPAGTWLVVLLAGPVVHWLFNVLLWRRGFKARPA